MTLYGLSGNGMARADHGRPLSPPCCRTCEGFCSLSGRILPIVPAPVTPHAPLQLQLQASEGSVMYEVLNCLATEHDWRLVVLAGAICSFARAVAISLFQRARASHGRARAIWICLDAAVGGCGIWATHFVAMLAYDPGANAGYSIPVTLLSLFFAIIIVATGLCVALSSPRQAVVALGGAVIGGGVAAMHY